jgi:exodeoxyribonuclease V alpha subunit
MVELRKSYRFGPQSGIRAVSDRVNDGDGTGAVAELKRGGYADVRWVDLPQTTRLSDALDERAVDRFQRYLEAEDIEDAFARFDAFRILCALRKGPYGVRGINRRIEERLCARGLIPAHEPWYRGRPVLVTRNDYTLGIFNGDVGIVWPEGDRMIAFFRTVGGRIQRVHPARLPEHETVYAMTVHKSQGSEFDHVLFVLPDKEYPVITRELIYTGFTRARRHVEIWAKETVFISGVSRQTRRMSGLRDLLWGERPDETEK